MKRMFLMWFRTMVTIVVVGTMAMMIFSLRGELSAAKRKIASLSSIVCSEKNDGVWVLCRFDLKPDADIEAYKRLTLDVVPKVRAEDGCRLYTLLQDSSADWDKPMRFGERTMWMVERWDSVDALKAHLEAPHMKAFGPAARAMRSGGTFHVLEEVRADGER